MSINQSINQLPVYPPLPYHRYLCDCLQSFLLLPTADGCLLSFIKDLNCNLKILYLSSNSRRYKWIIYDFYAKVQKTNKTYYCTYHLIFYYKNIKTFHFSDYKSKSPQNRIVSDSVFIVSKCTTFKNISIMITKLGVTHWVINFHSSNQCILSTCQCKARIARLFISLWHLFRYTRCHIFTTLTVNKAASPVIMMQLSVM